MKNIGSISKVMILSLSLIGSSSQAQTALTNTTGMTDISVLPMAGPNMSDVVIDSNLTLNNGGTTFLDLYVSCYGTNLRSVANPLSPASMVKASVSYLAADGSTKVYKVEFPGKLSMVKPGEGGGQGELVSRVETTAGILTTDVFRTQMKDSMIRVAMSSTKTVGLDVLAAGTSYGALVDSTKKSSIFTSIKFDQVMPSTATPQQYMGWNGPLTASVRWYVAENGKNVSIYASFPGETSYCGGYFSPLMLKFNKPEVAPKMLATSKFPLSPNTVQDPVKISWPSFLKEENIYFLAVDQNANGLVDNGSELLGDVNGFENGFLNLAIYDENKDGAIDEKDSIFKKLILWKDSNHNGKSEKFEVKALQDLGVSSISLDYKKELTYIGDSAKILGPGSFQYVDKKSKSQTGAVWDVYMKMVP
ncbi:hypothetical protein D3C87_1074180 [compost metagenome]